MWSQANTGLPDTTVIAFAVSGTNLFAGTDGGGVYLSTNYGTNWIRVNDGLTDGYVNALAVCGTNLFAGTYTGVFRSTNSGANWTHVNAGLADNLISAFAVSGTNIFAGADVGVFLSTNGGANWTQINDRPTAFNVNALAVCGGYLFAGTYYEVWRRPLYEMITSAIWSTSQLPRTFLLLQNYPNPFNPTTTIRYALPGRVHVTLSIFNTLGQEVATLVNESEEAGYHEIKFDGTNLASGMYFYRIQAGSFLQTKELLLLR
jgi:hypothetical protein